MKTLTVKLPDALFAEIAAAAKARNVSKSDVVRERIARPGAGGKLKRSLWSVMEDLVIESDSLARDLSSNKTHLRGYGKNRAH
ncbi:MAG: ribbon-helix-helix protein, CopG family [Verrucomicrobiales bacterium]